MRDEKFRKALDAYVDDHGFEETKILDDHAYDGSIVGITGDGRIVYDLSKMVTELMSDEGWSFEDATEWVEYNTLRAIPYMGEGAPIVLMDSKDDILDIYGEE